MIIISYCCRANILETSFQSNKISNDNMQFLNEKQCLLRTSFEALCNRVSFLCVGISLFFLLCLQRLVFHIFFFDVLVWLIMCLFRLILYCVTSLCLFDPFGTFIVVEFRHRGLCWFHWCHCCGCTRNCNY